MTAAQLTLELDGPAEIFYEGAAQRSRDACDRIGALRFRLYG
jgi:hypothetical protein